MKHSFVFIFSLLSLFSHSQPLFQTSYGGKGFDNANAICPTTDHGFILAGTTNSFGAGYTDVYVIKTDSLGDTLWTRSYGGAAIDGARSIQQTKDGGYIIAGYTQSFGSGNSDYYVIKLKTDGDTLWTKAYGGPDVDEAYSIQQTMDKGFIIAGLSLSFVSNTNGNAYLIKTDSLGNLQWTRVYGGTVGSSLYCVKQTKDTGYVMTGSIDGYGAGGSEIYVIKTNKTGDTLWQKNYGGTGQETGNYIEQTPDSGYIIAASTTSFGAGGWDAYIIKTNRSGDTLWTCAYGGMHNDYANTVHRTQNGNYIIGGYYDGYANDSTNVSLLNLNQWGDTLWSRGYGGTKPDAGFATELCGNRGCIITGYTKSFYLPDNKVYLVRTDSLGNNACNKTQIIVKKNRTATQVKKLHIPCADLEAVSTVVMYTHTKMHDSTFFITNACMVAGIAEGSTRVGQFNVFPNPSSSVFIVSFENEVQGPLNIAISNVLGEMVYTAYIEKPGSIKIDLSNQASGTYFMKCSSNREQYSAKVMISR